MKIKKILFLCLLLIFCCAFTWEGELNPDEFSKWEILSIQPTPQGLSYVFIKNPDPNSPIEVVAMMVGYNSILFGYRYFKYGEPYVFAFDPEEAKYKQVPLTEEQKKGCMECHEKPKIPQRAV